MRISSYPDDILIGTVRYCCKASTYNMRVSRIGIKNKSDYNNFETVNIKNEIPKKILNKTIKCIVQYRDAFNVILCTAEILN